MMYSAIYSLGSIILAASSKQEVIKNFCMIANYKQQLDYERDCRATLRLEGHIRDSLLEGTQDTFSNSL